MALYISDEDIERLTSEVQELTKAPTKTDAVRRALENELVRARETMPLEDRLAKAKAIADAMGKGDPDFDMKRFTDEMWGGCLPSRFSTRATTSSTPTLPEPYPSNPRITSRNASP